MSKLELYLFKRILRKEVRQGGQDVKIRNIYKLIREAVKNEYSEDNDPTRDDFLRQLFEETQFENTYKYSTDN